MAVPYLFYSDKCPHCRKIIDLIKTNDVLSNDVKPTNIHLVDRTSLPKGLNSVPAILVNKSIFQGEEAIKWVDFQINRINESIKRKNSGGGGGGGSQVNAQNNSFIPVELAGGKGQISFDTFLDPAKPSVAEKSHSKKNYAGLNNDDEIPDRQLSREEIERARDPNLYTKPDKDEASRRMEMMQKQRASEQKESEGAVYGQNF